LATALGIRAIEHHRRGDCFCPTIELVNALGLEKACGTQGQMADPLAHADLVIPDQPGGLPFSQTNGTFLFHLLSKLYEKSSVVITTNLSFAKWAAVFGDPRMAPAPLDRLNHHAHVIETGNESCRSHRVRQ
jgi:DNA replication protein DnaC